MLIFHKNNGIKQLYKFTYRVLVNQNGFVFFTKTLTKYAEIKTEIN